MVCQYGATYCELSFIPLYYLGIELRAPLNNAIQLKLVLDGRTVFRPPAIEKNQPLTWTNTSM